MAVAPWTGSEMTRVRRIEVLRLVRYGTYIGPSVRYCRQRTGSIDYTSKQLTVAKYGT